MIEHVEGGIGKARAGIFILARFLADRAVDALQKRLVLHGGKVPGLAVDGAGRLHGGQKQRVELFLGDLLGQVGAVAAARGDQGQGFIHEDHSFQDREVRCDDV